MRFRCGFSIHKGRKNLIHRGPRNEGHRCLLRPPQVSTKIFIFFTNSPLLVLGRGGRQYDPQPQFFGEYGRRSAT
ncbi:MAG: hypothetical protein RLZZ399_2704 [Verrucomicrobiota bacterium]|jgi:hypothetical protein